MSLNYKPPVRVPAFGAMHSVLIDDDMYYSPLHLALGYIYKHRPSGRQYRLIEIINPQTALMQSVDSKEMKLMPARYFVNIDAFNDSKGFSTTEYIGDAKWMDMQNRYHAILVYKEHSEHNNCDVRNSPIETLVDEATLIEWYKAFKSNYVRANLLERNRIFSDTPTEFCYTNTAYTKWSINDHYLNARKLSVEGTIRQAHLLYHKRRLYQTPTDNALRKLIANLPDIMVMNTRGYKGVAPLIDRPLGVIPKVVIETDEELDYYEDIL